MRRSLSVAIATVACAACGRGSSANDTPSTSASGAATSLAASTSGNATSARRAKSASVQLNGRPIGVFSLTKGETKIVNARMPTASILRGNNELTLKFNGGPRGGHDPLAEIDWIRVGPNDGDAPYSAPTRSDAL